MENSIIKLDYLYKLRISDLSKDEDLVLFNKSILRPVFKESQEKIDKLRIVNYTFGFIDINKNFYPCPLVLNYIQVNYLIEKFDNSKYQQEKWVESEFIIFSNDFKDQRTEKLSYKENSLSISYHNFYGIFSIVNKYIDSGRPLHELDMSKLDSHLFISGSFATETNLLSLQKQIIPIIDHLKMDFYENSMHIPRKDDAVWKEVEISNLPDSKYLYNLLLVCCKKMFDRVEIKDYGFFGTFGDYSVFNCTGLREKLDRDESTMYERSYKYEILLEMASKLDVNEYSIDFRESLLDRLIKKII